MQIIKLPYYKDSRYIYDHFVDAKDAVFLDSGFPKGQNGRYDIISSDPYITLTT